MFFSVMWYTALTYMLYKELHNGHVKSDHVTDKLVHTIEEEVGSLKLFGEPFFCH